MLVSRLSTTDRSPRTHTCTSAILGRPCWLALIFGLSHMLETLDGRQKLALNPELPGAWLLSQRPQQEPSIQGTDRQTASRPGRGVTESEVQGW